MAVILALAALLTLPLAALGAADAPKPNIVIFLADDLGWADLGVQGSADVPTPNLDRLAARGARFTDAYANASLCAPTRAALMSGRYQQRLGVDAGKVSAPLPKGVQTLPERLRAAGYTTAMVGKWHLGDGDGVTPVDRGFDEFFGFTGGGHTYTPKVDARKDYAGPILRNRETVTEARYLTNAFGAEAAAFLERQRDATKPFFLYVAFNAVHQPIEATPKYLERVSSIGEPTRRTYAAMTSAMDDAIGLVLAKLDAIGKTDDTLVVFTNDNGGPSAGNAANGSRNTPLRGGKSSTFEGGIRVPLLMEWPGVVAAGAVYRKPVMTFDVTATALSVAGADTDGVEGVDLIPFVGGKKQGAPHDVLFWRDRRHDDNHAARHGEWKFVHSTEGSVRAGPWQRPAQDMLFDLASDVGEQRDLATQYPEKLAALKKLYAAWSAEVDADSARLGVEPTRARAGKRAARPSTASAPPTSDGCPSPALERIDQPALQALVATIAKELLVPGAVVLLRTPQGEIAATYGTTQLGTESPPRADTHFRIASNTKTMTAAVILQLAQEGSLGLDDPVSKYVPSVPNGEAITIAELLEMRSGLYDYTNDPEISASADRDPSRVWTPQQLLAIAFAHPPNAPPGTAYDYCNTNYALLGLVIERVDGRPLARAMQDRLFGPLGLAHTALPASTVNTIPEPYSHGYLYGSASVALVGTPPYSPATKAAVRAGTLRPNDYTRLNHSFAAAAGGVVSTAADLAMWIEALVTGRVLGAASQRRWLDRLQPVDPSKPDGQQYGYGIAQLRWGPNAMLFHGGETPGYNSFVGHDPTNHVTLVVWTNLTVSLDEAPTANALMLKVLDQIYAVSPLAGAK